MTDRAIQIALLGLAIIAVTVALPLGAKHGKWRPLGYVAGALFLAVAALTYFWPSSETIPVTGPAITVHGNGNCDVSGSGNRVDCAPKSSTTPPTTGGEGGKSALEGGQGGKGGLPGGGGGGSGGCYPLKNGAYICPGSGGGAGGGPGGGKGGDGGSADIPGVGKFSGGKGGQGAPTFQTPSNPRHKFIVGLHTLYADGSEALHYVIVAPSEGDFDGRMNRVWVWVTRVGLWTCRNMGAAAMSKATEVSLNDAPKVVPDGNNPVLSRKKLATMAFIQRIQQNLSDMLEHDAWDPIGRPVLPSEGCEKAVGKPTDPAVRF